MKKIIVFILLLFLCTIVSAQETYWTYYNVWCMGDSAQWKAFDRDQYTGQIIGAGVPWYMPTRKFFANRGKLTHIMIFPNSDIIRGNYAPYLSCTREYWVADSLANGWTNMRKDSTDVLYNGGTGNPGDGKLSTWTARGAIPELIDSCHGRGIKVLLTLNAVTPSTGWDAISTDTAKAHVFAYAVARYINTHNFDGIDVNVENSPVASQTQTARTIRILRQYLGSNKLITVVPPCTKWNWYNAEAIGYIDYCLPQLYGYGANWQPLPTCNPAANGNFLKAPLHKDPCPPGSNHQDITTWGVNQFYSAGWPKSKLVLLLSNEGLLFKNVDTMFSCSGWTSWFLADTLAKYMLTKGGTYHYDDVHVGAYISGTATEWTPLPRGASLSAGQKFYIATLDPKNIDSVIAWGRNYGYSGFGLYDVSTDVSMKLASPMVIHDYMSSRVNAAIVQNPILSLSVRNLSFGGISVGDSSTAQSFSLSGAYLTPEDDTIIVKPPAGFTVSLLPTTEYADSLILEYSGTSLSSTTIYVRFVPTSVQGYSGNVTNAGGGATTENVAVSGSGLGPTLTVSQDTISFGNVKLENYSTRVFTLSGANLLPATDSIKVSLIVDDIAPLYYQISLDNVSYYSQLYINYSSSTLSSTSIYSRFIPFEANTYPYNCAIIGGGDTTSVHFTGTGTPTSVGTKRFWPILKNRIE